MRTKAIAASLTAEQRTLVDNTILRSLTALGPSPKKLAEITAYVTEQCKTLSGGTYELYRWCDAAVQRLKREGRIELVRGAGGGWKLRSRRSKPKKSKARGAKPKQAPEAKQKKAMPKQKRATYVPFKIDDIDERPGATIRLSFFDWTWLEKRHGSIEIDGYYMNGPGVEGLVRAVMFANKIASKNVDGDSEGDACLLYFTTVEAATRVAQLAAAMMSDRAQLAKAIQIARDQGFED